MLFKILNICKYIHFCDKCSFKFKMLLKHHWKSFKKLFQFIQTLISVNLIAKNWQHNKNCLCVCPWNIRFVKTPVNFFVFFVLSRSAKTNSKSPQAKLTYSHQFLAFKWGHENKRKKNQIESSNRRLQPRPWLESTVTV